MSVEFKVLGPLQVQLPGGATVDRPSHRRMLAILLLDAGSQIETDALIDRFWGEQPPATAKTALQTHISALRKLLPQDSIHTTGSAYVLDVDPDSLDANRLISSSRSASAALESRQWEAALEAAQSGLALWRGRPYVELEDDWFALPEIARINEHHLDLVEARGAALLGLGRNEEAIPDLEALVVQHPLRERMWEQLITARHRVGRHAEAVRAATELRNNLAEMGLEPGSWLHELEQRVLEHDKALSGPSRLHNLPHHVTSFIGRRNELNEILDLLASNQLVTITGVGGSGKTRLALEVAEKLADRFPDGRWLADLASITDASLVFGEVAASLGLRPRSDDLLELLRTAMTDQHTVVVLDNCEHVIEAAVEAAAALLENGSAIRVLATSRETLGLPGEVVYSVPPMDLPVLDTVDLQDLPNFDAIRLFADRASRSGAAFAIDASNADAVVDICRRLDGIPLAIELAAARARALSPGEIANRLDDRFRLLVGGSRTVPHRHRTLEATLDWSYGLLDEPEKLLFSRLGVFGGGFDLGMAERVCSDDRLAVDEIVVLVAALVEKSLLFPFETNVGMRYRLLETPAVYARKRLADSGDLEELAHRHTSAFSDLSEELFAAFRTADQIQALERFRADHDNFRAALAWSLANDRSELALRIAANLISLREHVGFLAEAWSQTVSVPVDEEALPAELRVRALLGGVDHGRTNDPIDAVDRTNRAVTIARKSGLRPGVLAEAIAWRDFASFFARREWADSGDLLRLANESGDAWTIGKVMSLSGFHNVAVGLTRGLSMIEDGIEALRAAGDRIQESVSLWYLADAALSLDELDLAADSASRAIELAEDVGSVMVLAHAQMVLSSSMWLQGSPRHAESLGLQAVTALHNMGDRYCAALAMVRVAPVVDHLSGGGDTVASLLQEAAAIGRDLFIPGILANVACQVARFKVRAGDTQGGVELFTAAAGILGRSYDRSQPVSTHEPDYVDLRALALRRLYDSGMPEIAAAMDGLDGLDGNDGSATSRTLSTEEATTAVLAWLSDR